jgi:hypothetical protein
MKSFTLPMLIIIALMQPLRANNNAEDLYLLGFDAKNQAERLQKSGDLTGAITQYQTAYQTFLVLKTLHPQWQPTVVAHRLELVRKNWLALQRQTPTTPSTQKIAPPKSTPHSHPAF